MAIKDKDLWVNFFKCQSTSSRNYLGDFVIDLMHRTSKYNIPMDVFYDDLMTGNIITKKEGDCAIIYNPDYPKGCARFCILQRKNQYSTTVEGWKLYFTSSSVPPTARSTSIDDVMHSFFSVRKRRAEEDWNNIMEYIFKEIEHGLRG